MGTTRVKLRAHIAAAAVGLSCLLACAINPATGHPQLILVDEQQERDKGAAMDAKLQQREFFFRHPTLQKTLDRVGHRIAKVTPRSQLDWTFRILDSDDINALALPGGWIYVTREMLAHLNSEAELAAVLGHEIAHVTARHAAHEASRRRVAWHSTALFRVIDPKRRHIGKAMTRSLNRNFSRYSREHELEADRIGITYLEQSGYPRDSMVQVLRMLEALEHQSPKSPAQNQPDPEHRSHPNTTIRRQRLQAYIEQRKDNPSASPSLSPPGADPAWLHTLQGLVLGPDPRRGFVTPSQYVHPDGGLTMQIAEPWNREPAQDSLVAVFPEAQTMLSVVRFDEGRQAPSQNAFLRRYGLPVNDPQLGTLDGHKTILRRWKVQSRQEDSHRGFIFDIRVGDSMIRLFGAAAQSEGPQGLLALEKVRASVSIAPPTHFDHIQQSRIEIVAARANESLDDLIARNRCYWNREQVARLNRIDPQARLKSAQLLKIPRGGLPAVATP